MSSAAHAIPGTTPQDWIRTFAAPPVVSSDTIGGTRLLVRRWLDLPPQMEQPPLSEHLVALHLGGAKRVTRRHARRTVRADVALGQLTVIPAAHAYTWYTEGPVDFAHLYLGVETVGRTALEEFDRDPRSVELVSCVGAHEPLIEQVYLALLREACAPLAAGRLFVESLLSVLTCELLRGHSTLAAAARSACAIAPFRLRRVTEHVEAHLAEDLGLGELARTAGLSAYHFSRAFHRATGHSPYAYVINRRIERARAMLRDSALPLAEIARHCGFRSADQLAVMFKRRTGLSPTGFRRQA